MAFGLHCIDFAICEEAKIDDGTQSYSKMKCCDSIYHCIASFNFAGIIIVW